MFSSSARILVLSIASTLWVPKNWACPAYQKWTRSSRDHALLWDVLVWLHRAWPKVKQMQQYREFMFNSCLKANPQKYIVSLRVSKKNMTASGFLETSIEWRKTGNFYLPSATPNPPKPPPFPKKNTCWAFEVRDISLNLRLVQVTKFLSQRNWREEKRQHHLTIRSTALYGHKL